MFTVFCVFNIDDVGFMATLNITGIPLVIPPNIPPLLLVLVKTFSPAKYMASLASLPLI